jgi:hypothetical protein
MLPAFSLVLSSRFSVKKTLHHRIDTKHTVCNTSAQSKSLQTKDDEPAMKPSTVLQTKRNLVRETVTRFRATNPRVFGSVLYGKDAEDSDLDLLVDPLPGATLFDLGGLQIELEDLLGVGGDLLTPGDLPAKFRAQVLAEAIPV